MTTSYRIRVNSSKDTFRVQYRQETISSKIIRFFLKKYPPEFKWFYITDVSQNFGYYMSEEYARRVIAHLQKAEKDRDESTWSDISVSEPDES
jgi:hypothetical protein